MFLRLYGNWIVRDRHCRSFVSNDWRASSVEMTENSKQWFTQQSISKSGPIFNRFEQIAVAIGIAFQLVQE
jgi:hypothetical protein